MTLAASAMAQSCELDLLTRAQAAAVPEQSRSLIVEPGRNQRQLPGVASAFLTSLHCAAVESIVFINDAGEESGRLGWVKTSSHNDLVNLDAREHVLSERSLDPELNPAAAGNVWAAAIDAIVHEGTHAAVHLLESQAEHIDCMLAMFGCGEADPEQWSSASQALAEELVARLRLDGGFRQEWERLHRAFVAADMAREYGGNLTPAVAPGTDAATLTAAGFMSPYGSTTPGEDIAEWVAKVQTHELADSTIAGAAVTAEPEDYGCQALRAAGESITNATAAAYTKLAFLRDVGLVSQAAFRSCIGDLSIDVRGDGLHFFEVDGTGDRSFGKTFSNGLELTMGTQTGSGRAVVLIEVTGVASFGQPGAKEESPARATLTIDMGDPDDIPALSWPRGVYRIGEGVTGFRLTLDEAAAGTFVATHGFVLVTSSTAESIEGSIVLQRADRPFAPMGVPYAAADLPRITFRVSSSR